MQRIKIDKIESQVAPAEEADLEMWSWNAGKPDLVDGKQYSELYTFLIKGRMNLLDWNCWLIKNIQANYSAWGRSQIVQHWWSTLLFISAVLKKST